MSLFNDNNIFVSSLKLQYLSLQLDVQLLQLLVVFLLQLLQSQFSLNTDCRTRDAVQRAQSCQRDANINTVTEADNHTHCTDPYSVYE